MEPSPSPLRAWVKRVPFAPFRVTTSHGQSVSITTPGMVILGRRWNTVVFVDAYGFDQTVIIYHHHITGIDPCDPGP